MSRLKAQNDPWTPLSEKNERISQPPCDPRHQLIDSDRYIESLEKKLKRLKGRNKPEPSSRDIIDSLAGFKDDQMRRFLDNGHSLVPESSAVVPEETSGSVSYLQRRLYPERQALNMEELFELLKDDELARNRQEEEGESTVSASQAECTVLSKSCRKDVDDRYGEEDGKPVDSGKMETRELQDTPRNGSDGDEQRLEHS